MDSDNEKMPAEYDGDSDGENSENGSLFSRSSPVDDGERWRASPPPREIFGDGEWQFQIIGEEVDWEGNIQYQVRWDDWNRDDGTNTTWETPETIADTNWKTAQQKSRRILRNESLEIDVITTSDIHNTATYLRSQAYDEKLEKYLNEPQVDPFAEMGKLLGRQQEQVQATLPGRMPLGSQGSSSSPFPLRTNRRATTRQQTESSLASSSTLVRGSSRVSASSSATLSSTRLKSPSVPSTASSRPSLSKASSLKFIHVQPAPATTTAILKGKGKQIDSPPPEISDHHNSVHVQRSRSSSPMDVDPPLQPSNSKGKGKRVAPSTSNEEDSDNSMYTTPPAPQPGNTPRSSRRPFVLLTSRKKHRRIIKSESSEDLLPTPPSPELPAEPIRRGPPSRPQRIIETLVARRRKLSEKWTSYAAQAGGSPIVFVNEVDDEAIPSLGSGFRYLESAYKYAPGVERPDEAFLVSCSCDYCFDPQRCDCQVPSDLVHENGSRIFAYTPNGLFAFTAPKGMEVVECNKRCQCSLYQCINRVSQRPRCTTIEVFKTETRGWGVRATEDVKRGKVLGIYTGLVVHREDADAIPPELSAYRFDLDGDETEDHEPTHDAFSVDSRVHGNWTRFINHSCSPNLQIYLVVHDTPPNTGLPYIAFVAGEDIPARTEFTFDYDPKAAEKQARAQAKGKGKAKSSAIPEGSKPCHCGAAQCRGYITF
ncbi:hypothetical protein GALMADRAFT_236807 [Galerina marginata CBS 339.88]|uniref:SET domain-containing protein n=1 Tax=Galerina marginata (strain CBS 339.88) TaxID=685588 RepID=A0A067TLN2_GALM3|nr:hypothetical protein GALMADRAFT_236807 [Galerina marginata CBS 339.88]